MPTATTGNCQTEAASNRATGTKASDINANPLSRGIAAISADVASAIA